jgi:uncharacterized membrane protein YdcZ (DUF606 family)
MTQLLYILFAFGIGVGSATQAALLGSLGGKRGSFEATWISVLVNMLGLGLILGGKAVKGGPPNLSSPFDSAFPYALIVLVFGVALLISLRGIEPYYALTGIVGLSYLASAAVLAPRIGVALFGASIMVGTLIGSVALDHIGAFGGGVYRVNAMRVAGMVALVAGLLLIRGR